MTHSAGLLLFRVRGEGPASVVEVLVGHMGGPFWSGKDATAWTIPKGEIEPGEEPHAAALREFGEELGIDPPDASVPDLPLGDVRQRAGKIVTAWAREADLDVGEITGNTFALEWPPRSGQVQEFPELDRVAWVPLTEARGLVVTGQVELLDRLATAVDEARTGD